MAKITTIRILQSNVVAKNWPIHQCDVNNVFLHGDLDEEVYLLPPPGYTIIESQVCSKQWFTKLSETLLSVDFVQSKVDTSLFTRTFGNDYTILLCYVDDIILTGTSLSDIQNIKSFLHGKFQCRGPWSS